MLIHIYTSKMFYKHELECETRSFNNVKQIEVQLCKIEDLIKINSY